MEVARHGGWAREGIPELAEWAASSAPIENTAEEAEAQDQKNGN